MSLKNRDGRFVQMAHLSPGYHATATIVMIYHWFAVRRAIRFSILSIFNYPFSIFSFQPAVQPIYDAIRHGLRVSADNTPPQSSTTRATAQAQPP